MNFSGKSYYSLRLIALSLPFILFFQKINGQIKSFKKDSALIKDAIDALHKENYDKALPILFAAAEKNNPVAQYFCGRLYAEGEGVKADSSIAIQYFERSSKNDFSTGTLELGNICMALHTFPEAVKWFQLAAVKQGNAAAYNNLGTCFELGQGVRKDFTIAGGFYRLAAEKNNKDGQFNMGRIYLNGLGVKVDYPEGFKWLKRAARQGHRDANYSVGAMYAKGIGVEQNDVEAVSYLKKAVKLGSDLAKPELKYMFLKERGMPKEQAGIVNLGVYYMLDTLGVPLDLDQAASLFFEACSNNEPKGCKMLALCYENGFGLRQSLIAAKMYYRKADELGYPEAKKNLERLEK